MSFARRCSQRSILAIFPAVLGVALALATGAAPALAQTASCPVTDNPGIMEHEGIWWLTRSAGIRWEFSDLDAFSDVRADLEEGGRIVISAELTTGRGKTSQIIAVLIGVVAPGVAGFMDYTDDACFASDGRLTTGERVAACTTLRAAFRGYVDACGIEIGD